MTLLFFDGLDNANTLPKPEWDTAAAWTSSTGRRGAANGSASLPGSGSSTRVLTLPSPAATCIFGGAFQPVSTSSWGGATGAPILGFRIGATTHLALVIDATGHLQLRLTSVTGTVLATSTAVVTGAGTWSHIQVKAVIHATTGSAEVRLNGVPVITYTGQTGTASGAVTGIVFGTFGATSGGYFWDDLWVCDAVDATATQGRPNNDFLGDLYVVPLLPTAAGASTGWTPSGAGGNFAQVDEATPSTSDYVSASAGTPGTRDLYEVSDLAAGTLRVYGMRVGLYAGKSDVGTATLKTVLRDPDGAVITSTSKAVPQAAGPVYGDPVYVKGSGGVFTPADVNATQIGQETA